MPIKISDIIWISLAVFLLFVLGLFVWFKKERDKRLRETRSRNASAVEEEMESADSTTDEYEGSSRPKYATIELNKSECRVIEKRLEHLLREEKMYTNPFLRIGDVAKMAGITAHKLSFVLSQYLNISFYDYVNRYRIEEFKRMVKSGEWSSLTLTAMSEKAGFSSRSSFFRCFKKLEGITPGEYISKVSK